MPLDQKACQNDSRTADNKQTDINQDELITYLEGKKATLEGDIEDLSDLVSGMMDIVTDYSNLEEGDLMTNANFKRRLAVLNERRKSQRERENKLENRYLSVVDDKIPELQRKDAENQAIYDNLDSASTDTTM